MPYQYQCSNCQSRLKVPDKLYLKAAKCPKCQAEIDWTLAVPIETQPPSDLPEFSDISNSPVSTQSADRSGSDYWHQAVKSSTKSDKRPSESIPSKKKETDSSVPPLKMILISVGILGLLAMVSLIFLVRSTSAFIASARIQGSRIAQVKETIVSGKFLGMKGLDPEMEVEYEGEKRKVILTHDIPRSDLPKWANLTVGTKIPLKVKLIGILYTLGYRYPRSATPRNIASNQRGERVVTSAYNTTSSRVEVILDWETAMINPGEEQILTATSNSRSEMGEITRREFQIKNIQFTPKADKLKLPKPKSDWKSAIDLLDQLESDDLGKIDTRILKGICGLSKVNIADLGIPTAFDKKLGLIDNPFEESADLSFSSLLKRRVKAAVVLEKSGVPPIATLPSIFGLLAYKKKDDVPDDLSVIKSDDIKGFIEDLNRFDRKDRLIALESISKSPQGKLVLERLLRIYLDRSSSASTIEPLSDLIQQEFASESIKEFIKNVKSSGGFRYSDMVLAGGVRWLDMKEVMRLFESNMPFEKRVAHLTALRFTSADQQTEEFLQFLEKQSELRVSNQSQREQVQDAILQVLLNLKRMDLQGSDFTRRWCDEESSTGRLAIEYHSKRILTVYKSISDDQLALEVADLFRWRTKVSDDAIRVEIDKTIQSVDPMIQKTTLRLLEGIAGLDKDNPMKWDYEIKLRFMDPLWLSHLMDYLDRELDYRSLLQIADVMGDYFCQSAPSKSARPWSDQDLERGISALAKGFARRGELREKNLLCILEILAKHKETPEIGNALDTLIRETTRETKDPQFKESLQKWSSAILGR